MSQWNTRMTFNTRRIITGSYPPFIYWHIIIISLLVFTASDLSWAGEDLLTAWSKNFPLLLRNLLSFTLSFAFPPFQLIFQLQPFDLGKQLRSLMSQ